MTQGNVKLITKTDQLNMVEAGKRGKMYQVSQWYAEAKNKHMEEADASKTSSYIVYEGAQNLCRLAMCKPMTRGDYALCNLNKEEVMNFTEEAEHGYLIEVGLKKPEELHGKFNEYPLAPEQGSAALPILPTTCQDRVQPERENTVPDEKEHWEAGSNFE